MRAPARIAPGRAGEPDACYATRSRPRPRSAGPDLPDHGRQPAVPQTVAEAAHQGGVAFSCSHLRRRTKSGRRKPPCMQAINCSSPRHVKPGQALRQPDCPSIARSRQHARPSPKPSAPLSDMTNTLQNPHPVLAPLQPDHTASIRHPSFITFTPTTSFCGPWPHEQRMRRRPCQVPKAGRVLPSMEACRGPPLLAAGRPATGTARRGRSGPDPGRHAARPAERRP